MSAFGKIMLIVGAALFATSSYANNAENNTLFIKADGSLILRGEPLKARNDLLEKLNSMSPEACSSLHIVAEKTATYAAVMTVVADISQSHCPVKLGVVNTRE